MRILATLAAFGALLNHSSASAQPVAPIEVMVLGTYHFANPGRDLHNITADDVLSPRRQAELAAVVEALAGFRPTRVTVERQVDTPDLAVPAYSAFIAADLGRERSEVVQIGFRLARAAGLARVEGIDEQPGPGEPDYFPFGPLQTYAEAHGQAGVIGRAMEATAAAVRRFEARQRTASIAELLALMNDPDQPLASHAPYYEMLRIGDRNSQPGAELNAYWYMRNAKIFAKLVGVARPGDRIVVVYGAGHGYWLRHFARETPGFAFVDPRPYLARAARATPSGE